MIECLLNRDPNTTKNCKPSDCPTCGWNKIVNDRRREYQREHGLTKCKDGLFRLVMTESGKAAEK